MENHFSRFIKKIQDTQDIEIDCSTCLDLVSSYVDFELENDQIPEILEPVKQHIDQCDVCREEYQILRNLAGMEAEYRLPSINRLTSQVKGFSNESLE